MELYEQYKHLKSLVEEQEKKRSEIMLSAAYTGIKEKIESIQAKLDGMLSEVKDSKPLLDALEPVIIADMKKKGVKELNGVKVKLRKNKAVNGHRVLDVFGGDMDMFMTVSTIKQSDLKKFYTDNEEFKKPLQDCVEVTGETIIGLTL